MSQEFVSVPREWLTQVSLMQMSHEELQDQAVEFLCEPCDEPAPPAGREVECVICADLGDQCVTCEEAEFAAWADRHFASADYRQTSAGVFIQDWMRHSFAAWQARGKDVTRLQAENAALQQRLNVADQRVDELEDAATVASMRIRELDLTFGRYFLGMKSAVIADESGGNGMEWIFNGLAGPGELPPEEERDAQAYFDREVEAIDVGLAEVFAFHDARRKARQVKQ
jgi:hypothetical protein